MFKYQDIAKVGERIRAYDFHGRYDCYVEGVVQRIDLKGEENGFAAFVITVDKDGWPEDDKGPGHVVRDPESRVGCTTHVPMEVAWMEWDGRILNLTRDMARLSKGG